MGRSCRNGNGVVPSVRGAVGGTDGRAIECRSFVARRPQAGDSAASGWQKIGKRDMGISTALPPRNPLLKATPEKEVS